MDMFNDCIHAKMTPGYANVHLKENKNLRVAGMFKNI